MRSILCCNYFNSFQVTEAKCTSCVKQKPKKPVTFKRRGTQTRRKDFSVQVGEEDQFSDDNAEEIKEILTKQEIWRRKWQRSRESRKRRLMEKKRLAAEAKEAAKKANLSEMKKVKSEQNEGGQNEEGQGKGSNKSMETERVDVSEEQEKTNDTSHEAESDDPINTSASQTVLKMEQLDIPVSESDNVGDMDHAMEFKSELTSMMSNSETGPSVEELLDHFK